MINRYDAFYLAMAPIATAVLGYKSLRYGKYRESTPHMLGRRLHQESPDLWRGGSVWVHAVSVGEVIAAKAMLPLLRAEFHPLPLLVTTVTETGQAQARSLSAPVQADAVRYFPMDFSWNVRRFAALYRPRVFVLMETELWPNALGTFAAQGAKIFVLNGKISDKSFRSYRRIRSLLHNPLSKISAFCMQTDSDAEKIRELTGRNDNVFVTGNCKFDVADDLLPEAKKQELRTLCGVTADQPVVVAGSTHPGEEEIVLSAFEAVRAKLPDAVLLLVPRHPERFDAVWELVRGGGIPARRLSQSNAAGSASIVLIDRMGLLSQLYAIADAALVAGSLVPGIGGHNILEPALHAVPVLYGPYMNKQPDMVRILGAESAGVAVQPETLAESIIQILTDRTEARRLGENGRAAVLKNRGSAVRNMEIIRRFVS